MSDEKRKNLGRGLAALFGEEDEEESYAAAGARGNRILPIEHLHPNPNQPRRNFDEESIAQLAESVRESGILQPILVRPHPTHEGEFEIVAGERRWRAAQKARLHEVPVIVRDLDDRTSLELALVENVQRQDLGPLEEAEGYQRLLQEFGHSQEDLARVVGKSRSHVANTLRLLNLPPDVKKLVSDGHLSAGHARALLNAADPLGIARRAVDKGLSVREVERLAQEARAEGARAGGRPKGRGGAPSRAGGTGSPDTGAEKDPNIRDLEHNLSQLLGLRVTVTLGPGTGEDRPGTLSIHYQTLEQLDDVLERLHRR